MPKGMVVKCALCSANVEISRLADVEIFEDVSYESLKELKNDSIIADLRDHYEIFHPEYLDKLDKFFGEDL